MGQAAGASRRQPRGAGGFLCRLDLHLGGPAHDSADVCELLLLPPPPRDKGEGVQRLSQWSSQEGGRVQKAFLRGSVPTPRQTLERAPGGSR
uniref:Uncharacterized protein n=1 Tax=Gasterosteus aculeatus TaxID=69293 RepID=G3PIY4_GASAC